MSKKPWMPLYIADFLKDTTHLGALESGAYLHLIMDYWQNGKLPADDRLLARIAKMTEREWKKARAVLQAFFHDGWKHKRIDIELAEASKITESNVEKARDAANKRWAKHNASKLGVMPDASSEHAPSNAITDATTDAPECTLHTSQSKKDIPAGAGSTGYAFEGGVIRLNQRDFDQWVQAFSHLDLRAELLHLSEWAATLGAKRWYHAVQKALANKNREVKAKKDQLKEQGGFKWNGGIEGVI